MEKLGSLCREMKSPDGDIFTVYRWILLTNGWEVYQTEPEDCEGLAFGWVLGDCSELGSFLVNEFLEHAITTCEGDDLKQIEPPPDFSWGEFTIVD